MTKKEFVSLVAKDTKLTIEKSKEAVDVMLLGIMKAVQEGGVNFSGFGTFKKVEQAARTCRNPKTGEKMEVGAKNVVKFKPGITFKESLN